MMREEVRRGWSGYFTVSLGGDDDVLRGREVAAVTVAYFSPGDPRSLFSHCKPLLLGDDLNEFSHNPDSFKGT